MDDSHDNRSSAQRAAKPALSSARADQRQERAARTGSVTVLDPDPAVRDSLLTLLELGGHDPIGFSTAGEFFRAIPLLNLDTVICEARLPDASGFEVYRHVRQLVRPVSFLLLVTDRVASVSGQARRFGIQHVFPKPVVNSDLLALISLSGSTDSAT